MQEQLGVVNAMEPYMGKFFSAEYVRMNILKQTETEMKEIDAQIKKEIKAGILPDPNVIVDPATGLPVDTSMDLGKPITEPDLEKSGKATELLKEEKYKYLIVLIIFNIKWMI